MPWGLKRFQPTRQLHFIRCGCFHRRPNFTTVHAPMIFELALERVRRQFGLCVYGYVVMPEHVHLLVSEPAGAIRIGNAVGAAFTSRRVFEPVEAQILFTSGALLVILSVLFAFRPKVPAYALVVLLSWIGLALLYRGYRLYREGKRSK